MTKNTRLFDTFKPSTYDIHVELTNNLESFNTECLTTGVVNKNTSTITLHARALIIKSLEVTVAGEIISSSYQLDSGHETLTIHLESPVITDAQIQIKTSATGEISPTMHGVYPASYTEDGEHKTIVSTQFESHFAREMFPCVDEPSAKAEFNLTVTAPSRHTVISNTPVQSSTTNGEIKTVVFETTPLMSTYLLAFASGELGRIMKKTSSGVEVSIYAPIGHSNRLEFALDVATRCLEVFEEYFGIPYPLAKCDHVAIPEFAAAAMENWGCITYRESALVLDPEHASLASKQYIASVIAHELAHQWFGNLVTMEWWEDLWLNEGFATWASYEAVDAMFPDWNIWDQFVVDDFARAMALDALESSHPIKATINDPREISEIFDAVTYSKGSSIIRMLNDYLGDNLFRKGLHEYLKKHEYSNASTDDLWESLTKASGIDVSKFMATWTEKTGYPILAIENLNNNKIRLSQERFTLHPKANDVDYAWQIPLFSSNSNSETLRQKSQLFESAIINESLNKGRSGLYRVSYPKHFAEKLSRKAAEGSLNAVDRLGLLDDSFSAAQAGKASTLIALNAMANYKNELNPNVLDEIASNIGSVNAVMFTSRSEAIATMSGYVSTLIAETYKTVSWHEEEDDTPDMLLARRNILALAVAYGHQNAAERASLLFESYKKHGKTLKPDFRGFIYSHAVHKQNNRELYEWFVSKYKDEPLQEEKSRLTNAITSFESPEIANRNFDLMQTDTVRKQDMIFWLARLLGNRSSRAAAWSWYRENWEWLCEQYQGGPMFNYLAMVLAPLSTFEYAQQIRDFFDDKDTAGMEMSLLQTLEKIETIAYWRQADQEAIHNYFTQ